MILFSVLCFNREEDHILTESIEDSMIDSVEEIIDENPRQSPSPIIVLVSVVKRFRFFFLLFVKSFISINVIVIVTHSH